MPSSRRGRWWRRWKRSTAPRCLAREAGAWLHIVHISSGRGVAAALEARARGTNLTIETCPHYLFFTGKIWSASARSPNARLHCARRRIARTLWRRVLAGDCRYDRLRPLAQLARSETRRGFLPHLGRHRGRAVHAGRAARGGPLCSRPAAREYRPHDVRNSQRRVSGSPARAGSRPGYDADLALVDLGAAFTFAAEDLHQRHRLSPIRRRTFPRPRWSGPCSAAELSFSRARISRAESLDVGSAHASGVIMHH